jgi:CubicO group peptidase (beta-lactamase class C family)
MTRFIFIALTCLFSAPTLAQTPLPAELVSTLDAFVTERRAQGKLPRLSLVIVKDGQVFYTKGYGFGNLA